MKRKASLDCKEAVRYLSKSLAGDLSDYLFGQEENVQYLLDMVERTVKKGESNSLLVLGPHGVGKTAVVRKVT